MIKQTDIAIIILVVAFSLVVSYFVGNSVINTDANRSTQVEVVAPISADFSQPDTRIFNSNAINPTELIQIGDNDTDRPFTENND